MRKLFSIMIISCFLLISIETGFSVGADDPRRSPIAPVISLLLNSQISALDIKELTVQYSSWAKSRVAPTDKAILLGRVSQYVSGGSPPYFTDSDGEPTLVIPSQAAAYYILGAMAVIQDSRTAALWCFAEAAMRNPTNAMFLNNFAFMLMEFEKFQEARAVLEYVVQKEPDFLSAQVNWAVACSALGDFRQGADGFHRAASLFPRRADYYNLGAQAYHLSGQDAPAWIMASIGQQYFSDDFDFGSIINGLDYPSTLPGCNFVTSCIFNKDCTDFLLYSSSKALGKVNNWESAYIANILNPELLNAALSSQQCQKLASNRQQICLAISPPPLWPICHCNKWIADAYCGLVQVQTEFGVEAVFHGLLRGRYLLAQGEVKADLNAIRSKLSPAEHQYLACKVHEDFALILDGVAQDERDTLSVQMQDILIARSNINTVVSGCNQHFSSFELWIFTSGASIGSELSHCYGPVCVGYDPTGKGSISYAFGPAAKLAYDPFNENLAFSLGAGVQFGVGALSAGAAISIKIDKDKKGVAISGGALYTSAEYFLGFQRIPVKAFYQ